MTDYATASEQLLASILRGDTSVQNRPTLGPNVDIRLFQALRLIGMGVSIEEMVGDGARALVYQSGQRVGMVLGRAMLPRADKDLGIYVGLVRDACLQLTLGALVPEKVDLSEGFISVRVDECVSCAGIRATQAPICHFEAGLVGGVVRAFFNCEARAVETRCNAIGDSTCAIDVKLLA